MRAKPLYAQVTSSKVVPLYSHVSQYFNFKLWSLVLLCKWVVFWSQPQWPRPSSLPYHWTPNRYRHTYIKMHVNNAVALTGNRQPVNRDMLTVNVSVCHLLLFKERNYCQFLDNLRCTIATVCALIFAWFMFLQIFCIFKFVNASHSGVQISAAMDIRYSHPDMLTYIHSDICRITNWSCSLVAIFVMM